MTRYIPAKNGDKIKPRHSDYRMACCDCGLVHTLVFEVGRQTDKRPDGSYVYEPAEPGQDLQVAFTVTRNDRATAAMRREKRKKGWRGVF